MRYSGNHRWQESLSGGCSFKYVGREFTLLSKPFKTKQQAEKERRKYSERQRKGIALGLSRIRSRLISLFWGMVSSRGDSLAL